jgi:hypothetical protein
VTMRRVAELFRIPYQSPRRPASNAAIALRETPARTDAATARNPIGRKCLAENRNKLSYQYQWDSAADRLASEWAPE